MPIAGVICPYDNTYQSFETCIQAHDYYQGERSCHCPVEVLKLMRDNHIGREHAGWSASTMTSCARAVALEHDFDYYEDVKSGYNKARGEWVHAIFESDKTPKPGVIKEKRVRRHLHVAGYDAYLTGRFDKLDPDLELLIDYKSKDRIPTKPDPHHEAQFNIYVWLVSNGHVVNKDGSEGEAIAIPVTRGGMHYLTFNPKDPFRKMFYPVWEPEQTERFLVDRMTPLLLWKEEGIIPRCNAYVRYGPKWKCQCVKLTEQLEDRGLVV